MQEAEAYEGPSLIIAYSTCIGQGIEDMSKGIEQQRRAVASGHWPLFRYNPRLEAEGKSPFAMDSKDPTIPYAEYAYGENRFKALKRSDPAAAAELMKCAEASVQRKLSYLKHMADWLPPQG